MKVRHATNGQEMIVELPGNAKFKHIKAAVARRLESDEILERGQLINNVGGIYSAYKDNHHIGDVREVLALCVDMTPPEDTEPPEGEAMRAELREEEMTDDEGEQAASKAASADSSVFNWERAIALQRELLEGFEAPSFQRSLRELMAKKGSFQSQAHFAKERQQLFLTVQSKVLPKYGFEGSQPGVLKMMGAMGPFVGEKEFMELAREINAALGVDSPPETWAALSKSCRKVEEEPRKQPARKPLSNGRRGLPGLLGGSLGAGLGAGFGSFAMPATVPLDAPASIAPVPVAAAAPRPAAATPSGGPSTRERSAATPSSASTAASGKAQAPAASAEDEEAPLFEPWPPQKAPPFKLFIAGSWNDYKPLQMQWQEGMFACPVTLGPEGSETFQLLRDASWEKTFYPNVPDASALEEHSVSGPDAKGHGLNWQIGKYEEEEAKPRARFVVIAGIDKTGMVRLVSWQPVG